MNGHDLMLMVDGKSIIDYLRECVIASVGNICLCTYDTFFIFRE